MDEELGGGGTKRHAPRDFCWLSVSESEQINPYFSTSTVYYSMYKLILPAKCINVHFLTHKCMPFYSISVSTYNLQTASSLLLTASYLFVVLLVQCSNEIDVFCGPTFVKNNVVPFSFLEIALLLNEKSALEVLSPPPKFEMRPWLSLL